MLNIEYENKELCASCGGICCKRGGCDYSANDFSELKFKYLESKLQEGFISISSMFWFDVTKDGKLINLPILYLRARNINRPIVDLLSMNTRCSALEPHGCKYNSNERPSGGLNLIPRKDEKGISCYPLVDQIEIIKTWIPYQKILSKLVKRFSGKTVTEQLKIDIEELFYKYLNMDFAGIDEAEIQDTIELIPNLAQVYPEEYQKAYKRYFEGFNKSSNTNNRKI